MIVEGEVSDLLVRDVDPKAVARLKARAALHGRSLQAEVKAILEAEAVLSDQSAWLSWMDVFRAKVTLRSRTDTADLLRESRDER
jgi:antitoxin FitA